MVTLSNAIVYGSGYVEMGQMVRAGIWLNAVFVFVVTAFCLLVVPVLTGRVLPSIAGG